MRGAGREEEEGQQGHVCGRGGQACRRVEREEGEEGRERASLPAFSHALSAIVRPQDAARED